MTKLEAAHDLLVAFINNGDVPIRPVPGGIPGNDPITAEHVNGQIKETLNACWGLVEDLEAIGKARGHLAEPKAKPTKPSSSDATK
jgi:hypothetical protein